MNVLRQGWSGVAAIVAVCAIVMAAAAPVAALAAQAVQAVQPAKTAPDDAHPLANAKGHLIDRKSVYVFLTSAKEADGIADPLQRCLKYPDPPGSHWSAAAVTAYCQYRTYPRMSFEQVRDLLQQGQFDELERRLAAMLQDKLTNPAARNVMDRAVDDWFHRPDLELRPLLENWKRAKPKSAFAYAASGLSYVAMAKHARGGRYVQDTPASNMEAMERLMASADEDLRHAIELDPKVTPAYVGLIDAARYAMGDAYFRQTVQKALRADPANFAIYNELMWALRPEWGGSIEQMTAVGKLAAKHVAENPTLLLLQEKPLSYEAGLSDSDCSKPGQFEQFSVIFDQVAVANQLIAAGKAAGTCGKLELSVVYYSEALRFYPEDDDARIARAGLLNDFDESAWSLKEVDRLVQQNPHEPRYFFARGYANESLQNYGAAEKDYLAASALDPGNRGIYAQLSSLYLEGTHDWEKAWKLNERLVQMFPDEPYFWLQRSYIQQQQPRPGLKDTADYFEAHFDKSPEMHQALLKMRAAQALQDGKARAEAASTSK